MTCLTGFDARGQGGALAFIVVKPGDRSEHLGKSDVPMPMLF